jgi:archaemetzincin
MSSTCSHSKLTPDSSAAAAVAGYWRLDEVKRLAAAREPGVKQESQEHGFSLRERFFPAPLVLPCDDLAYDPEWLAQSVQDWLEDEDRNEVTKQRKCLYIASFPTADNSVDKLLSDWKTPSGNDMETQLPRADSVVQYLKAFYNGMDVKQFSGPLKFTSWNRKSSSKSPKYVGLETSSECIGIRTRDCPDKTFNRQLNLNDLIDALMTVLPDDAYALLMLVEHDIHEGDEDDFCVGRAYGGSRVGVVSTARLNPALDEASGIDRNHAWPASHCADYVNDKCVKASRRGAGKMNAWQGRVFGLEKDEAWQDVIRKFSEARLSRSNSMPASLSGLWLGRIATTASHELGHCFGIDHCVYYACVMQGSASIAEGDRQTPYLCPVDLAKILRAIGTDETTRDQALLNFCNSHQPIPIFAAYAAWMENRLSVEDRSWMDNSHRIGTL